MQREEVPMPMRFTTRHVNVHRRIAIGEGLLPADPELDELVYLVGVPVRQDRVEHRPRVGA